MEVAATITTALALLVLAAPSTASAWQPAPEQAAVAHQIAVEHWGGAEPCNGQVHEYWAHLREPGGRNPNATSTWATTNNADPATYHDCSIAFSYDVNWDWPKYCTIVMHEIGHLRGHDHNDTDPDDIMYPYYGTPAPECTSPQPWFSPTTAASLTPAPKIRRPKLKRRHHLHKHLQRAFSTSVHALPLGIQDAQAPLEQRNEWAAQTDARWERFAVYIGQPGVAAKIRESHQAGRHIILTVGGLGTRTRRPSFTSALRYIRTLPRVERYTISNEPDLDGVKPCAYRKGWMPARRVLGKRLLWGDLSSHHALTFTQRARICGPLPSHLDVAVHPYQSIDPLRRSKDLEAGLGDLNYGKRWLKANAGVTVSWWITEFGYAAVRSTEDGLELDGLEDHDAAWMWPRALKQAKRVKARVLVIYTAQGPSWDTRPRELAWAAIRNHS
jgi:hypothetical protein